MIISRAPVRISMGGGGTDLPSYYERFGGFLMAASINKYVYVMANKRFYESIRLSYSKTEIVDRVDDVEHNIFREAMKLTKVDGGIELVSIADVPAQCGLGTSSAFTVAMLNALYAYKRSYRSLGEIAEAACEIEINMLKEPIGKQDQYAAAHGGFNAYWFEPDGSVNVEPVSIRDESLEELRSNLYLFHMKKEREAGSVLQAQDKKTRDGDEEVIERLHRIKQIGLETRRVFENGDIDSFGEILHEHWLTKKGLSDKVSDPFIDEAYDLACRSGATGGKIVGAGGGGYLMVYCPRRKSVLVSEMEKLGLKPMWFSFEREGAKIVYHG